MKNHPIDPNKIIPCGKTKTKITDGILDVWTTHSVTPYTFNLSGDSFKRNNITLPGKYRLPFRIDMTVRLTQPCLILLVGDGHISFGSPHQDNRKIEDIAKPSGKPNQDGKAFDNSLPFGEFTDISVIYHLGEMQVQIGGTERLYMRNPAYRKAKNLAERNNEGFAVRLVVSKLSVLSIKSISVTEYDETDPFLRNETAAVCRPPAAPVPVPTTHTKATFETVTAALSAELKAELQKTDQFLKALRPLKCKRTVDPKSRKITYLSSGFGISYVFHESGAQSFQHFGWYIVANGKPETWHVKADDLEETLNEIAAANPQLANRIFYALNDCIGCYGARCLAKRAYTFDGQKRVACHGRILLNTRREDFQDIRAFFGHLNQLMERKAAEGNLTTEKIFLQKNPSE